MMEDADLKRMIWQEFGAQLKEHGVTEITLERRDAPPKGSELPSGTFLYKLGVVGKYAVWWVKGLVKGVIYALTLFITLAELPDAQHKFRVYYPTAYEIAVKTIDYVQNNVLSYKIEYDRSPDYRESYIVIDPQWRSNPQKFRDDQTLVSSTMYVASVDRPLVFVSSASLPWEYTSTGQYAPTHTFPSSAWAIKEDGD